MRFDLVDAVLERSPERIVTLKHITAAEEYLQDHFPGYPVLPGVMMLEAMVQAARRLLQDGDAPMVLGGVRALKYGRLVRPGNSLRVEVSIHKRHDDGSVELKGEALLVEPGAAEPAGAAASGRFSLRPPRTEGFGAGAGS